MFTNNKEIWDKLVEYCPEETDFFFNVDKKIEKMISPERAFPIVGRPVWLFTVKQRNGISQ